MDESDYINLEIISGVSFNRQYFTAMKNFIGDFKSFVDSVLGFNYNLFDKKKKKKKKKKNLIFYI